MADLAGPPPPSRLFFPISLDIKALKIVLLWPKPSDFWQKYVVIGNNRKVVLDIHAYALAGSKRSQNNSCSRCCQVLLFLSLVAGRSFYPLFLVLNLWEKGKARPEQDIVSELAITEVLLRPKSLSHKFLSTDPRTGHSGLNKFRGKGASHLALFCICCQFIFHSISWCSV